jgi:hypothetical protein
MRSKLDKNSQPATHGTRWNDTAGVVIKGISRGPGVTVELFNPRRAQPRRVLSSEGVTSDLKQESGKLTVISDREAGEPINIIVEY